MYRRFSPRSRGNKRHFNHSPNITPGINISNGHPDQYVRKAQPVETIPQEEIKNHFIDFKIDAILKLNIGNRGYNTPTPIQDKVIPHVLEGKDVVGIANTGTGKTAAFLIPLLNKIIQDRSQKVLIMAPTRELALQINEELFILSKSLSVYSQLCIGGTDINRDIAGLRRNPHFVIGTPGRLKDLAQRNQLNMTQFNSVVLDEVDRMVDIGFIRDIRMLLSLLPQERQSLFFSATVTREIEGIVQTFSKSPVTISVKRHETAANVDQDVIKVRSHDEKLIKLNELLSQDEFKKVIIFGRTKWSVEKLAKKLQQNGFTAASIHGNKSQNQRIRALTSFKQDRLQILVATDIAARGLDIENVSHVINYDEPTSYTDYIHRIGRTGRAGNLGKALTFVI